MKLDPVLAVLKDRLGLAPDSVGPQALRTAIGARMAALRIASPQAYARRLQADPEEFLGLVDATIVPESWFYRNAPLFELLAAEVSRRCSSRPVRLLSAPCGAGQEPYSLAFALIEAGLPRMAWSIDALDVSPKSLAQARRGVYSPLAFREIPAHLKERYFNEHSEGWLLADRVRDMVRFHQGNLLDPHCLAGEAPFDVILCRNVLIYLHDAARREVVAALARLLAANGLIVTGTAEALSSIDPRFEPACAENSFGYRLSEPEAVGSGGGGGGPPPPRPTLQSCAATLNATDEAAASHEPFDRGPAPGRSRGDRSGAPDLPGRTAAGGAVGSAV